MGVHLSRWTPILVWLLASASCSSVHLREHLYAYMSPVALSGLLEASFLIASPANRFGQSQAAPKGPSYS
jgi:hypothetical protein